MTSGSIQDEGRTPLESEPGVEDDVDRQLGLLFEEPPNQHASDLELEMKEICHIIDCLMRLSISMRNPKGYDKSIRGDECDIDAPYATFCAQHISEKFPKIRPALAERLGVTMAQRRAYLVYREEHSRRMGAGLLESEVADGVTTVASSLPQPNGDSKESGIGDGLSTESSTSYTWSTIGSGKCRIPPAPPESASGPFKCPLCHTIIEVRDERAWK